GYTGIGGDGGGAIILNVNNKLENNGTITADGTTGGAGGANGGGGGGSGGSIWVTTGILTGTGRFSSDGGYGGTGGWSSGGGGGGRIAIYYNETDWDEQDFKRNTVNKGLSQGTPTGTGTDGTTGTLIFVDVDDNNGFITNGFRFQGLSGRCNETITSSYYNNGVFNFNNLTILDADNVVDNQTKAVLNITDTIYIENATLDLDQNDLTIRTKDYIILNSSVTDPSGSMMDILFNTLFDDLGTTYENGVGISLEKQNIGQITWLTWLNGVSNISSNTNIANNYIFVNSSRLPGLNTSANITLYGLSWIEPEVIYDLEDDGSYVECPSNICTNLSYSGGVFVFNMTRFTSYSTQEGANTAPTQGIPILNSTFGTNFTNENLTVYNQSTYDVDGDPVTNKIDWYLNGRSYPATPSNISYSNVILNMPFENFTQASDTYKDYSTYGNDGTEQNGVSWNATGGHDGYGAYEFDGVDDYINLTDKDEFSFGDGTTDKPFSIEVRVKWTQTPSSDFIISKMNWDSPSLREWGIYRYEAGADIRLQFFLVDASTGAILGRYVGNWTPTVGTWYHIVSTYDGSGSQNGIKIYVDGSLMTLTDAVSGSYTAMENTNQPLLIGRWTLSADNRNFPGTIDEVRIYNISLSAGQIEELYGSRMDMIISQETSVGDVWQACITPNDGYQDGDTNCSNSLTITSCTDNDGDSYNQSQLGCGLADCDDNPAACGVNCNPGITDESSVSCTDGYDNDCDTFTDCDDPDCYGIPPCPSGPGGPTIPEFTSTTMILTIMLVGLGMALIIKKKQR
ncbi:LamG domain-containing protein, partial [Candidatus Woesearchaeota archaeon]|nr:LamG domain-containing protein [Candidatus Woesearchaeota archaeon]